MKSAILAAISAAALATGGMAYAQAPAAKATTAAHAKVATTKTATVTKPAMASSSAMATKATHVTHKTAAAPNGRMVTTKTTTGKTVTYNCSKAGNANKKACK
ncbi:hypothetical protein [uncultured Sphingomonas sp.]|uniref:hypothetical protein n=1 Tax=uncultured Sphingomonas sp. TaxID=158754 RepID=UPI0026319EAC|nr:hypothetical protein [uncultured Sphingomonas sp.]